MNDNLHIGRDVAIGAGIEAYRAYQATGDTQIAAKAAVSGGATVLGGACTGFLAFFGYVSAFGGFVSGEGGIGAVFLLVAVLLTWATVALVMAHSKRMRRYMAPQAPPAPPPTYTQGELPW